jgi:hypothetical protein
MFLYRFLPLLAVSFWATSLVLPFSAFAQDKFPTSGRINFTLGTGFGIYEVTNNEVNRPSSGALSGNFHIGGDYGLHPLLTLGMVVFRNGFATDKDSNDAARLGGAAVYLHLNFARRPKTTWFLTAGLGGTRFTYEDFDNRGKVWSSGSYVFAGLGFRRYFGNHLGITAQIHATGYDYSIFKDDKGKATLKTPSGNDFGIALAGVETKFGLVYALGSGNR